MLALERLAVWAAPWALSARVCVGVGWACRGRVAGGGGRCCAAAAAAACSTAAVCAAGGQDEHVLAGHDGFNEDQVKMLEELCILVDERMW